MEMSGTGEEMGASSCRSGRPQSEALPVPHRSCSKYREQPVTLPVEQLSI